MIKVILIALCAIAVMGKHVDNEADAVAGDTFTGADGKEYTFKNVAATVDYAEPYVNNAESTVSITVRETQTFDELVPYTTEVIEFEFEYVGANPIVTAEDAVHVEVCTDIEVQDCDSNCAPAFWIANGYCNDGGPKEGKRSDKVLYQDAIEKGSGHKKEYNFNCAEFWFDGGDCEDTAQSVKTNYMSMKINGGAIFLQKVTPNTPVLAMGILAVVAAVGVVMKRN